MGGARLPGCLWVLTLQSFPPSLASSPTEPALPSCVKTPAARPAALHPRWAQDGQQTVPWPGGCGEWAVGGRAPGTCGQGTGLSFLCGLGLVGRPSRGALGLWGWDAAVSLGTDSGLQPCACGVSGPRAAGSARSAGPGDPTNEGLGKWLSACLEQEGVGVTLGGGTGDRGCGGPGFRRPHQHPPLGSPSFYLAWLSGRS